MKDAVDHDPVQLLVESDPVGYRVFGHALFADDDVAGDFQPFCLIEGDDIGKRIMPKVLDVHFMQLLVRSKNKIEVTLFFAFLLQHFPYP